MSARLLIAGTHSSVGKTTVTLGVLAALQRRGVRAAPFKAGPDYIDPSLLAAAVDVPVRNLDAWLCGEATLGGVFRRGARGRDVALIEGVMGLFDGIGATQTGSTAALARLLECPVVLVLDVAAMSGTAAALALGCQTLQPGVDLRGVVLNRVGSDAHAASTAEAITSATGLPVLGSLPRDDALAIPERHLGLVPGTERQLDPRMLDRLAEMVLERFDVGALLRIADSAPPLVDLQIEDNERRATVVRIGVAQDRAFGFYYHDTLDVLAERGAELVPFSPLEDEALPAGIGGVYFGGGFPELYARELADNSRMRASVQHFARAGLPMYAECGGLMALGDTLTTFDGVTLPMFGVLPVASRMQRERLTIGYVEVEAVRDSSLMPAATRVRGHEFHWSVAEPPEASVAAYHVVGQDRREGFIKNNGQVLGSYVHLNLAGQRALADRFVNTCARAASSLTATTGPDDQFRYAASGQAAHPRDTRRTQRPAV